MRRINMTEEQANRMIELLEEISSKLDDVHSAVMYADSGDVVTAINQLKSAVKNK